MYIHGILSYLLALEIFRDNITVIFSITDNIYNFPRFWKISRKLLSVTFMVKIQPGDVGGGKRVY